MWINDLISILVTAGVGTFNTNIFASSKAVIPTGAGPFLSITETGGAGPIRTQESLGNAGYARPSAQIVARASTHVAARNMINAAYNATVGKYNFQIGSIWFMELNPTQEPFDLGVDTDGRIRYAFNVMAVRRSVPV